MYNKKEDEFHINTRYNGISRLAEKLIFEYRFSSLVETKNTCDFPVTAESNFCPITPEIVVVGVIGYAAIINNGPAT